LWLLTGGGAEGEGDEGDVFFVNTLGFSQRGKATAYIPTSAGIKTGVLRPLHFCGRGRLFEV